MSWTIRRIAVPLLVMFVSADALAQRAAPDSTSPARSQEREEGVAEGGLALGPGTRIRVYYQSPDTAPGLKWPPVERNSHHIVTGTLRSLRRNEMLVDDDGLLGSSRLITIPRGALRRVEVSRGRDRRRTLLAGAVGAAVGAAVLRDFRSARVILGGATVGAVIGATQLGERWEPESLPSRWPEAPAP